MPEFAFGVAGENSLVGFFRQAGIAGLPVAFPQPEPAGVSPGGIRKRLKIGGVLGRGQAVHAARIQAVRQLALRLCIQVGLLRQKRHPACQHHGQQVR